MVTGVRVTPFVFLQSADTAASLLKIHTWHDAPSRSASACTFLEITSVWTMCTLTSKILSLLSNDVILKGK